jgi:hypothetical protein
MTRLVSARARKVREHYEPDQKHDGGGDGDSPFDSSRWYADASDDRCGHEQRYS